MRLAERRHGQAVNAGAETLGRDLLEQFLNGENGVSGSVQDFGRAPWTDGTGHLSPRARTSIMTQKMRFRRRFSCWRRKVARSGIAEFWPAGFMKWLIASQIKARASAVRRRTLERQGMAMSPAAIEPNNQDEAAAWNELRPVLHAEVERLPEKYRIPVILCYLEGKTNEEVASSCAGRWARSRAGCREPATCSVRG